MERLIKEKCPEQNSLVLVKNIFETLKDQKQIYDAFRGTKETQTVELLNVAAGQMNKLLITLRSTFFAVREKVQLSIDQNNISEATKSWRDLLIGMWPIERYFDDVKSREIVIKLSGHIEMAQKEIGEKMRYLLDSKLYPRFLQLLQSIPTDIKQMGCSLAMDHLSSLRKQWRDLSGYPTI